MRSMLQMTSIAVLFISLACCGGNSSPTASIPLDTPGSGINALVVADQISYVTAEEALSSASISKSLVKFAVPTSGDYISDQATYYVYEESMQALDTVNVILCSINQTGYEEMVNQGDYAALINYDTCDRSGNQSSNANDQSSGQEINYVQWVVNSSRESNDSEQIVKAWILNPAGETSGTGSSDDNPTSGLGEMRVKMTITEGAGDNNPFGVFHMDIAGYDGNGDESFTVFLEANTDEDGNATIQMAMRNPDIDSSFGESVNAVLDQNSDSGRAYSSSNYGDYSSSTLVAYDSGHYNTEITDFQDDTYQNCLDRDDYVSSVYAYNLYDSEGTRKELNSGFSIMHGDSYGWASYYGIWLSDESSLTSGMTVTGEDEEDYSVMVGGGRLLKRTKIESTLLSIKDQPFYYWDYVTGTTKQISWSGTNFTITGEQVCTESGCVIEETAESIQSFDSGEYIYLWKDGYGNLSFVVPEAGLANSTPVYSYEEAVMTPADIPSNLTLYCYNNCPKGGLSVSDLNNDDPYYSDTYYTVSEEPYVYTFNPTTYQLGTGGDNVTIASGASVNSSSSFSWGIQSGYLVTSELSDPLASLWDQSVTYYWETGPNSWNRYMALLDANDDVVVFDEPMICSYENDDTGTYRLEYNGPGQLWGIPFELSDETSDNFQHWTSLFVIPDGTALDCTDGTYYSKAMSVEQFMRRLSASQCSNLDLPTDLGEPEDLYQDPDIGEAPEVTDDPAFVGGNAI